MFSARNELLKMDLILNLAYPVCTTIDLFQGCTAFIQESKVKQIHWSAGNSRFSMRSIFKVGVEGKFGLAFIRKWRKKIRNEPHFWKMVQAAWFHEKIIFLLIVFSSKQSEGCLIKFEFFFFRFLWNHMVNN